MYTLIINAYIFSIPCKNIHCYIDGYIFVNCETFSFAVLSRSEEDGIGIEELDAIQTDLETLLAAAGLRLKQLENEKQILVNWADKKDIKGFKSNKVWINITIPLN